MSRSQRFSKSLAIAACAWLAFAPAARAEVQLSLRDGRITLVAKDATLRQILTEWARVGKTTVVNVERVPGGPLTLELRDVPEGEALDILLRNLSGYMAAPRTTPITDASVYASIAVMPTVAPPASRTASASTTPAPFASPAPFTQNDDEENAAAQLRNGVAQPPRVPTFTAFPGAPTAQPQPGNVAPRPVLPVVRPGVVPTQPANNPNEFPPPPGAPPFTTAPAPAQGGQTPGAIGVSAPGMIAPAPATQPGQVPQRPPGD
jgi:hypothetical protein